MNRAPTALLNAACVGITAPLTYHARRYLDKPVTTQAVRKWLNGEAIPAGDKIRTLAKWLKASPHWLHYGEDGKSTGLLKVDVGLSTSGEEAITLPEDFQHLTPKHKMMIHEILRALLRAEKR